MNDWISYLRRLAALAVMGLALPATAQPYAYVPNAANNTVSVINTNTNSVVATLASGGSYPVGVAANAAGTRVYIGNMNSNTVTVINTADNSVSAPVALPVSTMETLAVNPAGTRGYALGSSTNNLVVLDLTTTPVSILANITGVGFNLPFGVVVSPDGSRVYVANFLGQNVGVVDASTHAVSFIATPGRRPHSIAIDATGNNLWIAHDNASGSVNGATRISNLAGTPVVGTGIATGTDPRGIAINPGGSTVYVANASSASVSAIDTSTLAVTTVATSVGPFGVAVTPDGSRVLVANSASNSVSVFNASLALVTTIGGFNQPYARGIFIAPTWLAAPPTADITGTITNSLGGGGMSGVTVANSAAPSTSTNGSGVYSFADLANGSYTVTPSVYNYIFSPLSRTVNLSGTNATNQNFVGTYNAIPDTTILRDLVIAANLSDTRLRNNLLAPLNAALSWLNGSDPNRIVNACSNLAKFISLVRQNYSAGKLTLATRDAWVADANDILALSGCPTR